MAALASLPPAPDCGSCGACCQSPDPGALGWAGPLTAAEQEQLPRPDWLHRLGGASVVMAAVGGTCVALQGVVGQRVRCTIYEQRPIACRAFAAGSAACDYHRLRIGAH